MDIGSGGLALAVASFVLGLLSPILKSYIDQTLGARIQRRETKLMTADQRSDEAAKEFLEGLEDLEARLNAYLKRAASRERSEKQAESQGDLLRAIWEVVQQAGLRNVRSQ